MSSRLLVFSLLFAYVKTKTLTNASNINDSDLLAEGLSFGISCETSQNCNVTLNLFCNHGRCVCSAEDYLTLETCSPKKSVNASCDTSYECSGKLACYKGQCQCNGDFVWNGTHCIMVKLIGSSCTTTSECGDTLFCSYGSCQCASGYYWSGIKCLRRKTINETCENSGQCDRKMFCYDGKCQCAYDQYWDGNKCTMQKTWNHFCRTSVECKGTLNCDSSQCKCIESEYWDKRRCAKRKTVNETCVTTTECEESLYCARGICQCVSTDFWNGTTCLQKKGEMSYCDSPLECKDTLQCTNYTCSCCENNYWNGLYCKKKRHINKRCEATEECQNTLKCLDGNCKCSDLEYWTEGACSKNICAVHPHCLNGATCQIYQNIYKCICPNGFLGTNCQYSDGKGRHFVLIFFLGINTPVFKVLPAINKRSNVFIFNFFDSKNTSTALTSGDKEFNLDNNVQMSDGVHHAGAEIISDTPVTLYGFRFLRGYSEGFFAIPVIFLSTHYLIPSFTISFGNPDRFAITPTHDNTVVHVSLKMTSGSITFNGENYSNNDTITMVLNKYNTFQLSHVADLSGTLIVASDKVAIVSGNKCNRISNIGSCQTFMEMILPINQLDNVYIIPVLANRNNNTVRILTVNDTSLTLSTGTHTSSHSLLSRNYMDFFHTTISYISALSDVMVTIYPRELPDGHGDSFMMTIHGVNQYLYEYEIMVPSGFDSYISIAVSSDFIDGFTLDGKIFNIPTVFSVSGHSYRYSTFSLPITEGFHHITHRSHQRFGLWVYGNHTGFDAYGYPAGMAFKT